MSKLLVINVTRLPQYVDVRHADQTLDSVRIMPRRRVNLRQGMTVDRRWLQSNPGVIQVHDQQTDDAGAAAASPAPVPVEASAPEPVPEVQQQESMEVTTHG